MLATAVDQRRAFTAQRFGGERRGIATDHDGGRVKLHELGICDHRARACGDRKAGSAGLARIGGDSIEMANAARGQHHRPRGE
jgi:hypothetical protein